MSEKVKKDIEDKAVKADNEVKVVKAIAVLQSVADSNITPRNIRKNVKDTIMMLQDKSLSPGVRAANAISLLDDVSQDPNMPSYARVTIWSAISTIESIRENV